MNCFASFDFFFFLIETLNVKTEKNVPTQINVLQILCFPPEH